MARREFQLNRPEVADDFLDLLLQPETLFPFEGYRKTMGLSVALKNMSPPALTRWQFESPNNTEEREFTSVLADCYGLFSLDFLRGVGNEVTHHLTGPQIVTMRRLAQLWGGRLAGKLSRFMMRGRLFQETREVVLVSLDTVPDEIMAEQLSTFALSPDFVREQARGRHLDALFSGDMTTARESMEILRANNEELEEEISRSSADIDFLEFWRYAKWRLKEALALWNQLSQDMSDERYQEMMKWVFANLAWYLGMTFRDTLISRPQKARAILDRIQSSPEVGALAEEYVAQYGWGGDRNRVFAVLYNRTSTSWPKPRSRRPPPIGEIRDDQDEAEVEGLWKGLQDFSKSKTAIDAIADALGGGLVPYLRTARYNSRVTYIRSENKAKGIEVPPDWSQEGMTDEEIRRRTADDIDKLKGKVVRDYEIETSDGAQHSLLEEGIGRESLTAYYDQQMETQRQALIEERIDEVVEKAGDLTPRQRLIRENLRKRDDELAILLQEKFGKPCSPGTVRKLKHDLFNKLRKHAAPS